MSRLLTATRSVQDWRERLADPGKQWRRTFSALENAASWELAGEDSGWLPSSLACLLRRGGYANARLLLAVAEHKVALPGGDAASQCDVWGIVRTDSGLLSLSVEAKAREPFGNETLGEWLDAGGSARSRENRRVRWEFVRKHLPDGEYRSVPYQLLHRCAAAVIEAERFGFSHAVFAVLAFGTPEKTFVDYSGFCAAAGFLAGRDQMSRREWAQGSLSVGWADCCLATDDQLAELV